MPKRKRTINPLGLFKKYYVTCDGKKFGPYKTMAKAKSTAEKIARVLEKPAKIMGATANPRRKATVKRKSKANPKRPKYIITATLRSTGKPKFKTVSASSLQDATRKARTWMNSTFKKSAGPIDFTVHSSNPVRRRKR